MLIENKGRASSKMNSNLQMLENTHSILAHIRNHCIPFQEVKDSSSETNNLAKTRT